MYAGSVLSNMCSPHLNSLFYILHGECGPSSLINYSKHRPVALVTRVSVSAFGESDKITL